MGPAHPSAPGHRPEAPGGDAGDDPESRPPHPDPVDTAPPPASSASTAHGLAERTRTERAGDGRRSSGERRTAGGPLAFLRELPGLVLVALFLALLIKTFLVQAFYIPSQSMEPTLEVGDRVLVNKFLYAFREPRRGDVIVFENPRLQEPDRNPISWVWHWIIEGLGVSADPEKDFIKRVIAVGGQTIELNRGRLFIDGEKVEEPYLGTRDRADFGPFTVPEGHLFVMGDNRPNSQDSRSALGPIPRDRVVGRAFIVIWPPSNFRWLSGG